MATEKQLRILILEDNASDAELVQRELRKTGLDFSALVTHDKGTYLQSLDAFVPDLVLADYSLPGFDGLTALSLARGRYEAVPVVIVSGAIGEETAIETLKAGATDYVLKQRLSRLGPVVTRALLEARRLAETRRAEEELARQQELLSVTLTSIGDAVISSDTRLRVTFLNPVASNLTGWTREEAAGCPVSAVFRIINEKTRSPAEDVVALALREKRIIQLVDDTALVAKDGREIPVEDSAAPILDAAGEVVGVVLVFHDVTAKRQAQKALWESEERFRLLVEGVKDHAIFMLDPEGRVATWNPGAQHLKGYTAQEIVGRNCSQFYTKEDVAAGKPRHDLAVAAERGQYAEEGWRVRKDGSRFWAAVTITALRDAAGALRGFAKITRDMSERKQVEEELRRAKESAEEASRSKGLFLANISHELRTPMNAILGMIDIALPRAADATVRDCLETAQASADLLLTLLNDLLDTSKIEEGKLSLESAPFSLRRTLDQTSRVLSARAEEKGLSFRCRIPEETPDALVGDRTRLQQVLINLAGNAIKFTERGEVEVAVSASTHGCEATLDFIVRDTGIGIPRSRMDRLFLPFSQADASTTRRFGGTGLGLSISQSLVAMMGGKIQVESEVGKGSTFSFTVRLPVGSAVPPESEASFTISPAPLSRLRILLVEDNPANQKLVNYVLGERGHSVEIASDGCQAIGMARAGSYDAILMDVQMPGIDGLDATKAIRAEESGRRRVPVIAMTAHAMKGDRERCLAAGMDGYLSKPIKRHEIISLVESLAADAAAGCPRQPREGKRMPRRSTCSTPRRRSSSATTAAEWSGR